MTITLEQDKLEALAGGYNSDPFATLGPHEVEKNGKPALAIRAIWPGAEKVLVKPAKGKKQYEMERIHPAGIFEAIIPNQKLGFDYKLVTVYPDGNEVESHDPYSFPPLLTDFDRHLFSEGTHFNTYEKLGAHVREVNGVKGVHFAVWAPDALRVSVVGDFTNWDGRTYPMRLHPAQGVWELFIPGMGEGTTYKYEIKSRNWDLPLLKADPYGFFSELRPHTASVVTNLDKYEWQDSDWMQNRKKANSLTAPVSIYELHLGSWKRHWDEGMNNWRWPTYLELADELVAYLKQTNFTHVEFLPVSEHPFDGSWGYQTTGFYAVTSRFGRPEDFMKLVDSLHQNGFGVFIDWVPAHFPKDAHGLGNFDGTHLYEHADPRQGEQLDWGTYVFNFGRNEVRNFLLSNALFWLKKYHVDGLRVDAVTSMLFLDFSRPEGGWIPNKYGGRENLEAIDFIQKFNILVHGEFPDVLTMAEESTDYPSVTRPVYLGGLGFDLKWNMGWMHDTLDYFELDPIYRRFSHHTLTFSLIYAFSENYLLPFSHDEVVHLKHSMLDKMPGDMWQKFANLRALYAYQYTHPGKKLLFMGSEFGQWTEWSEVRSLDWNLLDYPLHTSLLKYMHDLNQLYKNYPALYEVDNSWEGFSWLVVNDYENSILVYLRKSKDSKQTLVVACNFTPVPRQGYRFGIPKPGFYREIFNTDSEYYGGSNVGNGKGAGSLLGQFGEYGQSLAITLPPLGVVILELVS